MTQILIKHEKLHVGPILIQKPNFMRKIRMVPKGDFLLNWKNLIWRIFKLAEAKNSCKNSYQIYTSVSGEKLRIKDHTDCQTN